MRKPKTIAKSLLSAVLAGAVAASLGCGIALADETSDDDASAQTGLAADEGEDDGEGTSEETTDPTAEPVSLTSAQKRALKKQFKLYYGERALSGTAPEVLAGATIKVKLGKTVKAVVGDTGLFSFKKIPVAKVGKKATVTVVSEGTTVYSFTVAVKNASKLSVNNIYRTSTKVTGTARNVHKGDKIKVKVGKKTYTVKVKKAAKKLKLNVKIKKAVAGTKVSIKLLNKYKQTLKSKTTKVWYAAKLKRGMTKAQIKLVPGYSNPTSKSRYSWVYESANADGSIHKTTLYIVDGSLVGWSESDLTEDK